MPKEKADLTDKTFNRLKVLEFSHKKGRHYYWVCECSCGSEEGKRKIVRVDMLKSGKTKSCGCVWDERLVGDLTDKTFGRLKAKYQSDERSEQGNIQWFCECECGGTCEVETGSLTHGYTKSCGCLEQGRNEKALLAAQAHNEKVISENDGVNPTLLTKKTAKNNTTGVKGVSKTVSRKGIVKYIASITIKNKRQYLGIFDNLEDATEARKKAEEKYHKPYIDMLEKKEESR